MARDIKNPPALPLWRAAQVVVQDDALVQQFEDTQRAEHGRTTGEAKGDTFADAYDRSLHKDRYALARATPLLNALAEVAGDDGVLQGNEWKKLGPKFGALALQIAEKSKSTPAASGDKLDMMMVRLSPAAKAALAATTENIVGLSQMPVLARLADQAAQTKPLANHRLFAVQHLFASTYGLFEALQKAGVQPQGSVVFGKNYSTNAEVKSALEVQGFEVYADYAEMNAVADGGKLVGIEAPLLRALGEALQGAARAKPPQKLLLLDEGGKLNRMLHDVFPQHAHLCTIVEQTTNGLQNMAGITLQAPAVSVASSQLKRDVEGPLIGEDVAASTLEQLDRLDPRLSQGKTVGIVGYGAIGIATAEAFAKRGFHVVITDVRAEALAKLQQRTSAWPNGGLIEVKPRAEVLGAGIVVGCTGTGAMTLDEMVHLRDGAILVSAASGDHEFPMLRTKTGAAHGATLQHMPMTDWQAAFDRFAAEAKGPPVHKPITTTTIVGRDGRPIGPSVSSIPPLLGSGSPRVPFPVGNAAGDIVALPWGDTRLANLTFQQDDRRFMVLRGGTPVNLGHDLPPNAIQLTRSMLFAACVQAVDEKKPGWATFSTPTQQAIESHWRSLQG